MKTRRELLDTIQEYFLVGGLFNPEMMEHDKVQTLLLDVRYYLTHTPPIPIEELSPTPPCRASCAKCGEAVRIHREHTQPGEIETETWHKPHKNKFVTVSRYPYSGKCHVECIRHHCQTCEYDWETPIL